MSIIIGGSTLSERQDDRLSFGLFGVSGSGKTLGAASFGGGDFGKVIIINVEMGPEEGGGGATVLRYASAIHKRLTQDQILLLDVATWTDMQGQFKWLRTNAAKLVADGFRVLVLDSGTEMSRLIKRALTDINPGNLRGQGAKGTQEEDSAKKNHKRELVTSLDGNVTRAVEWDDYDMIEDRYVEMHSKLKQLPFLFVTTFLEKDVFDEGNKKKWAGIGPMMIGKALPAQMPAQFDAFFHCEQRQLGEHVWLTSNDPTSLDAKSAHIAKHRFGKVDAPLKRIVEADGVALLRNIGISADTLRVTPKEAA
jgi:hypothetical protein